MTEQEQESDIMKLFFYFLGSCFGVCFVIFFLIVCFSGRICIFIYYKVSRMPYTREEHENTPLIVESDYFPRPGYDGYCLLGQEDPPPSVLVFSHSINIDQGCGKYGGIETPGSGTFPKGILTPKTKREGIMRRERRPRPDDSLKSVSFNPQTEFQVL